MQTTEILYKGDEPVTIRFTEIKQKDGKQRHDYNVMKPVKYVGRKQGVTSSLNFLPKPFLIQWASNMAVQAMLQGQPPEKAKYAHRTAKEDAGDLGTRVHDWIDKHLGGKDDPYSPDMKPSVEGFLKWEAENPLHTKFHEKIVYSKRWDYCGKIDWGGIKGGKYGIIDFKTGNCDKEWSDYKKKFTGNIRAKTEHFTQDAGYDIAIEEELKTKAAFYGALYIPISGKVEYFETTDTTPHRNAFIAILQTKRLWQALDYNNKYRLPTGGLI